MANKKVLERAAAKFKRESPKLHSRIYGMLSAMAQSILSTGQTEITFNQSMVASNDKYGTL